MIIRRSMIPDLLEMAKFFPVVAILGPRQSGKTTVAQQAFNKHRYINLEDVEMRTFAEKDPKGFFEEYRNEHGIILGEFQNVPDILSSIQVIVDQEKKPGYFILTGSQNYLMNQTISQSLAGRISIHTLLAFSITELSDTNKLPEKVEDLLYQGSYPSIYANQSPPDRWYENYIKTYIERDVRQLKQVQDLNLFQTFIGLCAGRTGQILNLSQLGNDCGISDKTVRQWISVLEASYIVHVLRPHYKNFSKRLIKSPKLYFYDTGLVCSLLKIKREQIALHYMRGHLFETFVISEILKGFYNRGSIPHLYYWRDLAGNEVDGLLEKGEQLVPIEMKAGKTISLSLFSELSYWNQLASIDPKNSFVVYTGNENQRWSKGNVTSWRNIDDIVKYVESP